MARRALHAVARFVRGRPVMVCGAAGQDVHLHGRRYQRAPLYPKRRECVTCRQCLRLAGPGVHATSHAVVAAHVAELRAAARMEWMMSIHRIDR